MKKYFRITTIFLAILVVFTSLLSSPVFAESLAFSAEFNGDTNSTFGTFSLFQNRNAGNALIAPTPLAEAIKLEDSFSVAPQNNQLSSGLYSYSRLEAFNSAISSSTSSRFKSSNGFSIATRLKLDMSPVSSSSSVDGFGRTGLVLNIRDYMGNNEDNEFYICISNYQNQITAISLTGGDRNNLDTQTVYSLFLTNVDPSVYHTYLFVYSPLNGGAVRILVDGIDRGSLSVNAISHRTQTTGYYYEDFVSLSLINRSLNAHLNEAGTNYIASSTAYVDYLRVYNAHKDRVTLVGIDYTQDIGQNHNHTPFLDNLSDFITNDMRISSERVSVQKYNDYQETNNTINSISAVNELDKSTFFLFRGHGILNNISHAGELSLCENDTLAASDIRLNDRIDLSHTQAVLFVCCYSGYSEEQRNNLVFATVSKGAESAVGFQSVLSCPDANSFSEETFYFLRTGLSPQEAYEAALSNGEYLNPSIHNIYSL